MAKLLHFLSPYKKRVALMLLLLFGQTLGTLYIPTLTASIVNNGIVAGDLGYVWKTGGFMLLVAFLTVAVSISGTSVSYTHLLCRRDSVRRANQSVARRLQSDRRRVGASRRRYPGAAFLFHRKERGHARGVLECERAGIPQHAVSAGLRQGGRCV